MDGPLYNWVVCVYMSAVCVCVCVYTSGACVCIWMVCVCVCTWMVCVCMSGVFVCVCMCTHTHPHTLKAGPALSAAVSPVLCVARCCMQSSVEQIWSVPSTWVHDTLFDGIARGRHRSESASLRQAQFREEQKDPLEDGGPVPGSPDGHPSDHVGCWGEASCGPPHWGRSWILSVPFWGEIN